MIKATPQCNNVTYSGVIGINEPVQYGLIPSLIRNIELPSGGDTTVPLEYLWLSTTDSNTVLDLTWNVNYVQTNYDSSYQHPNPVYTKTWFRRCVRRQGCANYIGESEWIQVLAPNIGLPIIIKTLKYNSTSIFWEVDKPEELMTVLLKGSYGKQWIELGLYSTNHIDIKHYSYPYYQLFFYDIDKHIIKSNILYVNKRIIEDNDLNGKQYVIYNVNGQVITKGVFYKCIHLKENQIIKFY